MASWGAPHGVASLKVRQGTFDALKKGSGALGNFSCFEKRRTNVQQLTCNIDVSSSFYYLFFSFVLIELKPFVLKGKGLGDKL